MNEESEGLDKPQPKVIVIRPPERSPKEQMILEISRQANALLEGHLKQASTLAEFILAYSGIRLKSEGSIDWMWDYGEQTVADVVEFYRNDALQKAAARDAKVVEDLKAVLDQANPDSGNIQIALKRIRDRHGIYRYSVLGRFPKGVPAENPILGWTPVEQTQTNPDIIYFRPTSACVLHACDDLFKTYRGTVFEIPYKTRQQALAALQSDDVGDYEYQLKKTAEGSVKQDAGNYITIGLQSAFSNEPYVAPVSRFWLAQELDKKQD